MARIYNEQTKVLDIYIYGDIQGSDYYYYSNCYTPANMLNDLYYAGVYGAKSINLHISSIGGDVFAGFEIYNLIQNFKNSYTINTYIQGVCASIATLIALAGDTIHASTISLFMIHQPTGTVLNAEADKMRKMADLIDKVKTILITHYVAKTKKNEAEIRAAVDSETWYTPSEALDMGFVDNIYNDTAAPSLNPANVRTELLAAKITNASDFSLYNFYKFELQMTDNEKAQKEKIEALEARNLALQKAGIEAQLDNAIAQGKITADKKAELLMLNLSNEQLKGVLATLSAKVEEVKPVTPHVPFTQKLLDNNYSGTPNVTDRASWKYEDWRKNDAAGLRQLEANDPTKFNALATDYSERMIAKSKGGI